MIQFMALCRRASIFRIFMALSIMASRTNYNVFMIVHYQKTKLVITAADINGPVIKSYYFVASFFGWDQKRYVLGQKKRKIEEQLLINYRFFRCVCVSNNIRKHQKQVNNQDLPRVKTETETFLPLLLDTDFLSNKFGKWLQIPP